MKVKDLDGNESNLNLTKKKCRDRKKSAIFEKAHELIKLVFPNLSICTEIAITIKRGKTLYLDMYLPTLDIAVEVHGKQHYEYTPHYHKHKHRFGRAKLNDDLKKEWCELNDIRYVELAYNESREQWADKLRAAVR